MWVTWRYLRGRHTKIDTKVTLHQTRFWHMYERPERQCGSDIDGMLWLQVSHGHLGRKQKLWCQRWILVEKLRIWWSTVAEKLRVWSSTTLMRNVNDELNVKVVIKVPDLCAGSVGLVPTQWWWGSGCEWLSLYVPCSWMATSLGCCLLFGRSQLAWAPATPIRDKLCWKWTAGRLWLRIEAGEA